jgi:DNA-binding NarL/FixJ family response regulator
LDIQLAGISGLELHRQLTSLGSKTPVIYLTANVDPETRKQATANGCAGYFYKTDAGDIVIEAIKKSVVDFPKTS